MKEKEEIYEQEIYFKLDDFTCDPTTITQLLNIQPYKAWNKGDMISTQRKRIEGGYKVVDGKSKINKKYSSWWLGRFIFQMGEEIDNTINELLDLMLSKQDTLQLIYQKYKAEPQITLVSYYNIANFEAFLTSKVIEKINRLGASFHIDIYHLADD